MGGTVRMWMNGLSGHRAGFTPLFCLDANAMHQSRRRTDPDKRAGFTLVELMLVVIIIGILGAMVIPRMAGRSEEARTAVARADIDLNIATALKLYELDNGAFPTTEEGLSALVSRSGSAQNWKGPYLDKIPNDAWGRPYVYRSPGTHRPHDYDLSSLGRDGTESEDDIVNWKE